MVREEVPACLSTLEHDKKKKEGEPLERGAVP